MASIRTRIGKYQASVSVGGKRKTRTFPTEKEAQLWALQQEVYGGEDTQDRAIDPSMRVAMDKYVAEVVPNMRDVQKNRSYAKFLAQPKWTALPLSEVTSEMLCDWRDERYKMVSTKTVKSNFMFYRTVINYYYGKFNLESPNKLFRSIKLRPAHTREVQRLDDWEVDKLKEHVPTYRNGGFMPLLIDFALETGMRKGEMLKLEWSMVDFERGWLNLAGRITKTGQPRRIPITRKCEDAIKSYRELDEMGKAVYRTSAYFKTEQGLKRVFTVGDTQHREVWEKTKHAAGYGHLHWHDLRHEAISRLFDKGLTMPEAQSISGHATMEELTRYSHASGASVLAKLRGGNND